MSIRLIVGIMLAALAIETVWLGVVTHRSTRLPRLATLLPNIAAGVFLVLALGATTLIEPIPAVSLCVVLAGVAHACDLAARVRR